MKKEDLKNTKIFLPNKEDRIKFQKKVIDLGVEWLHIGSKVANLEYQYYYIGETLHLAYAEEEFAKYFGEHENKEIFLEDVMSINMITNYS